MHDKFQTPHIAVTIGAAINFVAVALFSNNSEVDTFGWYGTIASFGFIVVYFLVSVAAPVYLKKTGELTPGATIIGGLGAALMVLALAGSLYPVPAFPYNILPYGFLPICSLASSGSSSSKRARRTPCSALRMIWSRRPRRRWRRSSPRPQSNRERAAPLHCSAMAFGAGSGAAAARVKTMATRSPWPGFDSTITRALAFSRSD